MRGSHGNVQFQQHCTSTGTVLQRNMNVLRIVGVLSSAEFHQAKHISKVSQGGKFWQRGCNMLFCVVIDVETT